MAVHPGLVAAAILLAAWPAASVWACVPGTGFTSLGRTADGTQAVWRVTNSGSSPQTYTLEPVGSVNGAPFTVAAGQLEVRYAPLVSSAGTTKLNAACGTVSTKAAGSAIYEGPTDPGPTPTPGPASPSVISQITLGAYMQRAYTISDRTTSGLLARDRIARSKAALSPDSRVLLAAGQELTSLGMAEPAQDQPAWNVWTDLRSISIEDRRYGLRNDATLNEGTLGIDRLVGDNTIAGIALNRESLNLSGYSGSVSLDYRGVSGGPYVAHRLQPNVFADAWVGWGTLDNDVLVSGVRGQYRTERVFLSTSVTGQFDLDSTNWRLRPRLGLFIGEDRVDGFTDSAGNKSDSARFEYTSLDGSVDVNTLVKVNDTVMAQPFARLGVTYALKQINDGVVADANGDPVTQSPWAGSLRLGSRFLISSKTVLEANVGFLGLGQADLRATELRLALSFFL